MPEQLLIPYEAYFVLNIKTTFRELFKDSYVSELKEMMSNFTDEIGNVDIFKLLNSHHLRLKSYDSHRPIYFNYQKIYDLNPESTTIIDRDFNIYFNLPSFHFEVLQIIGDKTVTFSDSNNQIHTVTMDDDLKLFKKV